MFKYLLTALILNSLCRNLLAQDVEEFRVKVHAGALGLSKFQDSCRIDAASHLNKDQYEVFLRKRKVLDEYFRVYNLGHTKEAKRIIQGDNDLKRLAFAGHDFYYEWAFSFYYTCHRYELKLCMSGVSTDSFDSLILRGRPFPIMKGSSFFCPDETFLRLKNQNLFVQNLVANEDRTMYTDFGLVGVPSAFYKIKARFVGYIVPYFYKMYELIDITPVD